VNESGQRTKASKNSAELSGWLAIDKPGGMSSHDVLVRLRKRHRKLKMGHAGTLDPLATGLLLVAIGSTTRLVESTHSLDKSYDARIRLGAISTTDDSDGEVTEIQAASVPELTQIESVFGSLTGPEVLQIPPAVSAIHVDGKRAYDLVRKGVEVHLDARPVRIDRIAVRAYDWPMLDITVDCGAGTYIRSIARDAGNILGCGGLIEELRRTRIGDFHVQDSIALETAEDADDLASFLISPVKSLTGWPLILVDSEGIARIARGLSIQTERQENLSDTDKRAALIDSEGSLIALANVENRIDRLVCQPYRVFVKQ
jgi:tRNA pseudouridine55 synthase